MYLALAPVVAAVILGGYSLIRRVIGSEEVREEDRPVWPWAFGIAVALAIGCLTMTTYRRNQLYQDREALWQDVVSRRPTNFRAHGNLAFAALLRNDLDAALSHAERAVRCSNRTNIHLGLATELERNGDSANAMRLLRRGIELQRELLPAEDRIALRSPIALAAMLRDSGRDQEAAAICEPLLMTLDRVLGAGDTTTVTARSILAAVAVGRGDPAHAESISRVSMEAATRTHGWEHQTSQLAVVSVANSLTAAERTDEAEELLRSAMASGQTSRFVPTDVSTLQACLASMLERSGDPKRLAEAEDLRRSVLRSVLRHFSPADKAVVRAEVSLGNARAALADSEGRLDHVEKITSETLETAVGRLGLADPLTQQAAVALAAAFYRTDREEKAEQLLKEYLVNATRDRESGDGSVAPPTLVRNSLAGLWERSGKLDEAISLRKKILRDALDRHGPEHPSTQRAAKAVEAAMQARDKNENLEKSDHQGGNGDDAAPD
jgi:tetratricopeptide (TPR) repeat protein